MCVILFILIKLLGNALWILKLENLSGLNDSAAFQTQLYWKITM